jgi:hypothetical protein
MLKFFAELPNKSVDKFCGNELTTESAGFRRTWLPSIDAASVKFAVLRHQEN